MQYIESLYILPDRIYTIFTIFHIFRSDYMEFKTERCMLYTELLRSCGAKLVAHHNEFGLQE